MKFEIKINLLLLLSALVLLTSCIYDQISPETDLDLSVPDDIQKGYSLTLAVTLDKMGGSSATKVGLSSALYPRLAELEEIENYINPEKFRVFFFDDKDQFLFESKSRWVKLLSETDDNTSWLVAVPMFSYGNDVEQYDWDWKFIRESLTSASFKVAILANRPTEEYFPDLEDSGLGIPARFDNSGPFWTNENADPAKPELRKSVFDFHHCQWDPIYESKSKPTRNSGGTTYNYYTGTNGAEPIYYYVMGEAENAGELGHPSMSATSSWVDWGERGREKDDSNFDYRWGLTKGDGKTRRCRLPSKDYPIPMYGIQRFDKIENWTEGTPFNLSSITAKDDGYSDGYNHKSISLLRSVVRLDLMIPASSSKPDMLFLCYSNVYARCEPIDVWTPTEELWHSAHSDFNNWGNSAYDNNDKQVEYCEWKSIMYYGTITRSGDPSLANTSDLQDWSKTRPSIDLYRKRLSWFYGAWLDINPASITEDNPSGSPWWDFDKDAKLSKVKFGAQNVVKESDNQTIYNKFKYEDEGEEKSHYRYPRIFNSCIQRNQRVSCDENGYLGIIGGYHYFVVYTGERNINDPSYQYDMGRSTSSAPTCIYWQLQWNGKMYSIPITDYAIADNNWGFNAIKTQDVTNDATGNTCAEYMTKVHEYLESDYNNGSLYPTKYPTEDQCKNLPWPLLRNHVYRLTVMGTRAAGDDLSIVSENLHSESIKFY